MTNWLRREVQRSNCVGRMCPAFASKLARECVTGCCNNRLQQLITRLDTKQQYIVEDHQDLCLEQITNKNEKCKKRLAITRLGRAKRAPRFVDDFIFYTFSIAH